MELHTLIWDNPLLIKHLRSRLRPQQLVPAVAAVAIICSFIVWWASVSNALKDGGAFIALLVVQGCILFLIGTSEVAGAVAGSRESGMLDFHRISPQPPLATALGFVLGAPIREYVLFAFTLPFSLYVAAVGEPGISGWLVLLPIILTTSLLYHALAALAGAIALKPRGASGSAMVVIVLLQMASAQKTIGLLTIFPAASWCLASTAGPHVQAPFFGITLSSPVLTLIHQLPLLAFLVIALVRTMRQAGTLAYSRPQAVAFEAVVAFLALGNVWGMNVVDIPRAPLLITAYCLAFMSMLLSAAVSPNAGQFASGVRRARKLGLSHLPAWSDRAANWSPLLAFAAITATACAIAGSISGRQEASIVTVGAPIVVALCAIGAFGAGKQYFGLRFGKAGETYFALTLFIAWIVPLPVGALVGVYSWGVTMAAAIASFSPLAGVGLSSGHILDKADSVPIVLVATLSALLQAGAAGVLSRRAEMQAIEASNLTRKEAQP